MNISLILVVLAALAYILGFVYKTGKLTTTFWHTLALGLVIFVLLLPHLWRG
jgi:uncharacterized membrane protein